MDQAVGVWHDGGPGERLILPIGRRDGYGCRQVEAIRAEACGAVERHHRREYVRLDRQQPVEEGRVANPFTTARVPDDHDPIEIDLAVERVAGSVVPGAELLEVLEMHDPASVVLAEVEAVQKIDVDGRPDHSVRGHELTEIKVAGGRVLEWSVVAVREHHHRKRAASARDADVPVERYVRVEKGPRRRPEIGKWRNVDAWSNEGRIRRVVDRVLRERGHTAVVDAG